MKKVLYILLVIFGIAFIKAQENLIPLNDINNQKIYSVKSNWEPVNDITKRKVITKIDWEPVNDVNKTTNNFAAMKKLGDKKNKIKKERKSKKKNKQKR